MRFLKILIIVFFTGSVVYAAKSPAPASDIIVVKQQTASHSFLYFQGNIEPIHEARVLSPIAGIVSESLAFNYGDTIKKSQYLLSLKPSDQENAYRTSLLAYLRAKSSYSEAMTKYSGQKLLYDNKILARNEFQQYKNNFADQKLALEEALFNLKATIAKVSNNSKTENSLINNLSNLSLNDGNVYSALNRSFDEVKVYAPGSGVALLPPKDGGDNADSTELQKDSVVKLNQVLLSIGDFSGLKVDISVNEVSINRLQKGQEAEVTGPAFPGITLKGKVAVISYQAKSGNFSASLPEFPVTIEVPQLTAQQQKLIHAGMTAQVKISLAQGPQILIPIKAVTMKDGKAYVEKLMNDKPVQTVIKTGDTNLNQVAVIKGLKVGDRIVVAH
jgi:multidrug efflux pump subunit AcrA (membrane-fusion protein)